MNLRCAEPTDTVGIFNLIKALAESANLSHQVTGNTQLLHSHLFGEQRFVEAIVADVEKRTVGFALFFPSYTGFFTKPSLYLDMLFVLPEYRHQGIGTAMIKYLAKLAVDRDYCRLQWIVRYTNESALKFYQALGINVLPDFRVCRVTGDDIGRLAELSV